MAEMESDPKLVGKNCRFKPGVNHARECGGARGLAALRARNCGARPKPPVPESRRLVPFYRLGARLGVKRVSMAEQAQPGGANVPAPASSGSVSQTTAFPSFDLGQMGDRIGASLRRGDLGFAMGLVLIMVVLIMPLPPWLLDISLALSITLSALILMTVVFIGRAMEFNSFPVVLLIATLLRLALNLASTRLILIHGHEGTDAAGQVIQAFGGFIMGDNFVIGVIVFSILTLVNFMVITKGSTRIAEVTARFTLDAMPGKQMAIDADLSAGLIDEQEAKTCREDLQKESDFFGAMDSASKFVRGDAVAGLIITAINVIGGMIIGMAQRGMPFGEAADQYTRLSVGGGLVTQIPALVVSTAAGLMVSKGGIKGAMDVALAAQFTKYPKALGMSSFLAVCMAVLPGVPALPFLLLAGIAGGIATFVTFQNATQETKVKQLEEFRSKQEVPVQEEPISQAMKIDMVRLELGYGLLSLINNENRRLTDQIKSLRRALATDMGFVMPAVRI